MRPLLPAIQAVFLAACLTRLSFALPSTLPPHLVPRGPSGPATGHPELFQDMNQRLQRRRTARHPRDWDEEEEEGNRYDDDDEDDDDNYFNNNNGDDDDDTFGGEEEDYDPREQGGWMDQPLEPVQEQDPRVDEDPNYDDDNGDDDAPLAASLPVPQQLDDAPVRAASAAVADANDHAPPSPAADKPTEERVHAAGATVADTSAPAADTTPVTATFKPEMRNGADLSQVPNTAVKPVGSGTCPGSQCAPGDCERCWETCGNCPRPDDFYGCKDKSMWSLTFDDGPSAYTSQLLDVLKQKGVRATFFVLGSQAAQFPDAIRRMHQEGHEIASHTWSHPHLMSLTNEQIIAEIKQTEDLIASLTGGMRPRYIRPPYGEADDRVKAIFHAYGLQAVLWNMDTQDYSIVNAGKDPKEIVNAFSTVLASGSSSLNPFNNPGFVSLQHDIYLQSVQQEQDIIALLQGKGLQLVTVSQCTGDNRPYKDGNNAPVASLPVQPVGSTPMQATPVPGSPAVPAGATPLPAAGAASPVADAPTAGASNAKQLKDSATQPAGGLLVGSNDAKDSAAATTSAALPTLLLALASTALLVHP